MWCKSAVAVSRIAVIVAAGMLSPAIAGCAATVEVSSSSHHVAEEGPTSPPAGVAVAPGSLPVSHAVARRLPNGVFYVLAGANPASYNLWEISNSGEETQLTHNDSGYGISEFGASPAGIVMADASSGVDELARLTVRGPVFLPDGHGSAPAISSAGQIYYIRPPYKKTHPYFVLEIKKSFSATAHVVYQQRTDIIGGGWGPHHSVAVISGGHAPGTSGPTPRLLVIRSSGQVETIRTSFGRLLSNVTWGENAAGLAVTSWNKAGEVIYPGGRRLHLPRGWFPAAWNPAGSELLVWGPGPSGSIGIWSPKHPAVIRKIGALPSNVSVGKFAWLAQRAKK